MPHAEPFQDTQDAEDDALIQRALNPDPHNPLDLSIHDAGEKADDAINFEDLSDNDLADDEDEPKIIVKNGGAVAQEPIINSYNLHPSGHATANVDIDDLFGDDSVPDSDVHAALGPSLESGLQDDIRSQGHNDESSTVAVNGALSQQSVKEQQLQQELFARSRASYITDNIPVPPASTEELLTALWPKFQRYDTIRFMDLLPPKRARFTAKQTPRPPRILNTNKLNLNVDIDQARSFRLSSESRKRTWQQAEKSNLISFATDRSVSHETGSETDTDSDQSKEDICGVSFWDMEMLCDDWDISDRSEAHDSEGPLSQTQRLHPPADPDCSGAVKIHNEERITGLVSQSRTPVDFAETDIIQKSLDTMHTPSHIALDLPALTDPEKTTAHVAKKVRLDLNDSHLLTDESRPQTLPVSSLSETSYRHILSLARPFKDLGQRYNISNDEAYDLLKENHQHRVRGMLGNLHVEHSMPALRLQWPFFKTHLEKQEARSFHRPPLRVFRHEQISFSKPYMIKKKHIKGRDAQSLFAQSGDLSLNDNSNVLLLEYSEEHPMMLSNLGMGNKIVNHYRKQGMEDLSRPKHEIGEVNVLLPQDKSPLTIFSHIDPGEVITAIHNGMYQAPIFNHSAKGSDFLLNRTGTGVHGMSWYLRNIDHLYVVGQQFPSVDVPGPHSRKVTTASKNRLRMISFRMLRKRGNHRISVPEVGKHFIGSTDMQNRQKIKDFLAYDKDHKEWKMKENHPIPDEETVRTMVKPEDVCLLESMQVGQQHLRDAGLSKDEDDASIEDESKEDETTEQQLAPWYASRNFLNAAQKKAMLQLFGEGDPSARGEAFNLIKTSMKGGFRAQGESVAERIKHKEAKDNTGHTYNVAQQQEAYEDSIRRIWDAQKHSLSSNIEQSDSEVEDVYPMGLDEDNANATLHRSERHGSGSFRRRDDESASQSTRWSSNSQSGKVLEITRVVRDLRGQESEVRNVIRNPRVIKQYLKRRRALENADEDVLQVKPGDDAEENRRKEQRLKKELARLERNKERRLARDKQKGIFTDGAVDHEGTPLSPGTAPTKSGATSRKCANCGMVGHIKTNKKLCPMLNGTRRPEEGFSTAAFTSGAPTL